MNTIHPTAVIGDSAVIGRDVHIGPHAVVLADWRMLGSA